MFRNIAPMFRNISHMLRFLALSLRMWPCVFVIFRFRTPRDASQPTKSNKKHNESNKKHNESNKKHNESNKNHNEGTKRRNPLLKRRPRAEARDQTVWACGDERSVLPGIPPSANAGVLPKGSDAADQTDYKIAATGHDAPVALLPKQNFHELVGLYNGREHGCSTHEAHHQQSIGHGQRNT
jgi:hypothetical protein